MKTSSHHDHDMQNLMVVVYKHAINDAYQESCITKIMTVRIIYVYRSWLTSEGRVDILRRRCMYTRGTHAST